MHARKPQTQALPKPAPRILNDDAAINDAAVPALHRTVIESALGRVEVALQELDSVLRTYNARDPRVVELRAGVGNTLQVVLIRGDHWLARHPAEREG